jgi:hypothetical protein
MEDWFSMFLIRKPGISKNLLTYALPQVEKGCLKEIIS